MSGWIAVDFDGTLATYRRKSDGGGHVTGKLGEPIPLMVARVKAWLAAGKEVRIFTARCHPFTEIQKLSNPQGMLNAIEKHGLGDDAKDAFENISAIREWCETHIGEILTITCVKDYHMDELWDDRAVQVQCNTGKVHADVWVDNI